MINALYRLFRFPLAVMNGIVAVAGASLHPECTVSLNLAVIFAGVVLLAAGASALNQVQEVEQDSRMIRTRNRPLPLQILTCRQAGRIGTSLIAAGLLFVLVSGNLTAALLGIASVLIYLRIYTPLKQSTPYALLVGGLCGAFTPLIGWCAVGGELTDYRIVTVSGIIYLWQVPHFWLFQKRHGDDYCAAGFKLLSYQAGSRMFVIWSAALAAATVLLPTVGIITSSIAVWLSLAMTTLLAIYSILRRESLSSPVLNSYPLMLSLSLFLSNNEVTAAISLISGQTYR